MNIIISSEELPQSYKNFFTTINPQTRFYDVAQGEIVLLGLKEHGGRNPVMIYGIETLLLLDPLCLPRKYSVITKEGEQASNNLEWIAEKELFGKP